MVSGSAMMRPMKPSRLPHTERLSRMTAGLSPMACPMIRGVRIKSCMACTMANTASAETTIIQKLVPVYWDLINAKRSVGTKPIVCR